MELIIDRNPSSGESWSAAVVALHSDDNDDNDDNDTSLPIISDPSSPAPSDTVTVSDEKSLEKKSIDDDVTTPSTATTAYSSTDEVREFTDSPQQQRNPNENISPIGTMNTHVKITVTSNSNSKPPRNNPSYVYIEHEVLPTDTLQGVCLAYKISATRLRMENKFSGNTLRMAPKVLNIPINKDTNLKRSKIFEEESESSRTSSRPKGNDRIPSLAKEEEKEDAVEPTIVPDLDASKRRLRESIESLSVQVDDYGEPVLTTPERNFLGLLLESNEPGIAEACIAAHERLTNGNLFWNTMCGAVVATNLTIPVTRKNDRYSRGVSGGGTNAGGTGRTTKGGYGEANPTTIYSTNSDLFSRAGHSQEEDLKCGTADVLGNSERTIATSDVASRGTLEDVIGDGGVDILGMSERTVVGDDAPAKSSCSVGTEKTPAAGFNYLDTSTKERLDRLAQRRRQSHSGKDNAHLCLFRAHEAGLVVTPGGSARRSLTRMGLPMETNARMYNSNSVIPATPPPRMPLSPVEDCSPGNHEGEEKKESRDKLYSPPKMPLSPIQDCSLIRGECSSDAASDAEQQKVDGIIMSLSKSIRLEDDDDSVIVKALAKMEEQKKETKKNGMICNLSNAVELEEDIIEQSKVEKALAKVDERTLRRIAKEERQKKDNEAKKKGTVWSNSTEKAVARPSRTHHHMGCLSPSSLQSILRGHFASKQFSIQRASSNSSSYTRFDSFLMSATETMDSNGLLLGGGDNDDDNDSLLDDVTNTSFLNESTPVEKMKKADDDSVSSELLGVAFNTPTSIERKGMEHLGLLECDDATRDATTAVKPTVEKEPSAVSSFILGDLSSANFTNFNEKKSADERLKNLLVNAGMISATPSTIIVDAQPEDDENILAMSARSVNSVNTVAMLTKGGPSYRNADMFRGGGGGGPEQEQTLGKNFLINAGLKDNKSYDTTDIPVVDAQPEDDESIMAMSGRSASSMNTVAMLVKGGPSYRNADMFRGDDGGSDQEQALGKKFLINAGLKDNKSYDTTDTLVVDAQPEDDESILAMSTKSANSVAVLVRGGPSYRNADMFRGGDGDTDNRKGKKKSPKKKGSPPDDTKESGTLVQALKSIAPGNDTIKENPNINGIEDDDVSVSSIHSDLGELPELLPSSPPTDRLSQSARTTRSTRRATIGIMKSSASANHSINRKYQRSVSWNRRVFAKEDAKDAAKALARQDSASSMSVISFLGLGAALPIFRSDSIGAESVASSVASFTMPSLSRAHPVRSPKRSATTPPSLSHAHSIRSDFGDPLSDGVDKFSTPKRSSSATNTTSPPLLIHAHSIRSDFGTVANDLRGSLNLKGENVCDGDANNNSSLLLPDGATWENPSVSISSKKGTNSQQPLSNEINKYDDLPQSTTDGRGGEEEEEEHPVFIHPTSKTQSYEGVGMEIEAFSPAGQTTVVVPSARQMMVQNASHEKYQSMISVIDDSMRSSRSVGNRGGYFDDSFRSRGSARKSRSGSMFSRHAPPPPIRSLDDNFIIKNIHFERHSSEILRSLSNEDLTSTRGSSRGGKLSRQNSVVTRALGDTITDAESWDNLEHSPSYPATSADAWGVLEDEYAEGYGANNTLPFGILGTSANDKDCHPHVLSPPLMESLQNFLPPAISENTNFWLKYSLVRDGPSLPSLLRHIRGTRHSLVAIETVGGEVFGSFTSSPWRNNLSHSCADGGGFDGNNLQESFLWRMRRTRAVKDAQPSVLDQAKLESELDVYCWAGETNNHDQVQYCTHDMLAVGGGGPLPDNAVTENAKEERELPTQKSLLSKDAINGVEGYGLAIDAELLRGTSSSCATFRNPPLSASHADGSPFEILNIEVWTMTPCTNVNDAENLEMRNLFLEGCSKES